MALNRNLHAAWVWLTAPRSSLDGERPLDLLKRGEAGRTADAVRETVRPTFLELPGRVPGS